MSKEYALLRHASPDVCAFLPLGLALRRPSGEVVHSIDWQSCRGTDLRSTMVSMV